MPTYEYECSNCKYKFDAFHAMSADPLKNCPECNLPKLVKLIGMGAAAIVKGTETPCKGGRKSEQKKKQCMNPRARDKLGEGVNKNKYPFWRNSSIDKQILRNPEKYIHTGEVD